MAGKGESRSGQGAGSRRALLRGTAGLLALGAAGCGFRPLYGDGSAGGGDPKIAAELAATRVGLIPERFGQLFRRSLQQRLGIAAGGSSPPPRYELLAFPVLAVEGIGITSDGAATRARYTATANWSFARLTTPPETVANGFERAIDAFNIPPNQYFAADISRDATERRLADRLAEEVVTRLAVRLRNLRAGEEPRLIQPVQPPLPSPETTLPSTPGGFLLPGPGGGLEGGIGPIR
jgi:LPS-assembly lipoprotein